VTAVLTGRTLFSVVPMLPRKKTCYFPQANSLPFAVHHTDYGIYSELRITNVGGEAEVVEITVNDQFRPAVEVGGKEWFHPLVLPKRLRFGASLAVMLQGPVGHVHPEECYGAYPKKVVVFLADGAAVTFGLWEIIRRKA
jgi:hypothetical protein